MDRQIILSCLFVAAIAATGSGCARTKPSTSPLAALLPARNDQRARHISEWNDWADSHLQNGDIVFMRGDCYVLLGTVNFSDLSTDMTDSRFSHIGLVAIEDGQAYVYDIRSEGSLRTRFGDLLAHERLHQLAIKRHRDASPDSLAQAASYCRGVFQRREKYDDQLKLDNDRLYCTELVENAYLKVGLTLSEPIAIRDLPNYDRHLKAIGFVKTVTSIEPEQAVLVPGNDQFGIWANPSLDLILDLPDTKALPPRD